MAAYLTLFFDIPRKVNHKEKDPKVQLKITYNLSTFCKLQNLTSQALNPADTGLTFSKANHCLLSLIIPTECSLTVPGPAVEFVH